MWSKLLLAQMLLDFPRNKEDMAEAPVSEGRETVAAIERPADTTGSVEVDVSTERTVAALPEFTKEACKALDKYNI